jgi:hypothetical protein
MAVLISVTGALERRSWVSARCASVRVVWACVTAVRAVLRAGLTLVVNSVGI